MHTKAHAAPAPSVPAQDALKALVTAHDAGRAFAPGPVPGPGLAELLDRGLATQTADGAWRPTPAGLGAGRQLLRAHRLLEADLAERTSLAPEKWHDVADAAEHRLTPAETDALAESLGRPRFDPHGDPIPTRTGGVPSFAGHPLDPACEPGAYHIAHIEDEPPARFAALVRHGLAAGLTVEARADDSGRVVLRWAGRTAALAPDQAAALTVLRALPGEAAPWGSLDRLREGQTGVVSGLAPDCRGLMRRRLLDLGFVAGAKVKRESRAAFGGPMRFRVRGTSIALRPEQARGIFLAPPEAEA